MIHHYEIDRKKNEMVLQFSFSGKKTGLVALLKKRWPHIII
jgi:hypothetical protein